MRSLTLKNYKEFIEAILAGEILYKDVTDLKMKLCPTTGNLVLQQGNDKWVDYLFCEFAHYQDWKILPKTILINGIEVPEPEMKNILHNQKYYLVDILNSKVSYGIWEGGYKDFQWLNYGLIHLTEEAAIIHRDALLSFTQK
jgi:hypothetical protein